MPPPGWPKPPVGYVPAADWQPDPGWPAPPVGWRFWKVPRLRLTFAFAAIGCAIFMLYGTVSDMITWRRHAALDSRGVTTTALVLSYHYDPDGGDPDGWTSDRVSFTTDTGRKVVTTVGHHSPGPEQSTHLLSVTYDPQRPAVARPASFTDYDDDPATGALGGVLGLGLAAAAILIAKPAFIRRRPTPQMVF